MRRGQSGKTFDHGEEGLGGAGLTLHQRAIARQQVDLGDLCGLVCIFPDPGTAGVTGTGSLLHRSAEGGSVDGLSRLEKGDEGSRSLDQVVGEARGLGKACKRDGMGVSVHRQSPRLRVGPKPRAHSLTREGSPLPPCLSLFNGSAELRLGRGKLSPESGDDAVGAVAETLASLKDYLRA